MQIKTIQIYHLLSQTGKNPKVWQHTTLGKLNKQVLSFMASGNSISDNPYGRE